MHTANKLKSKTGSSLFLTLIFAMFCFFVGGTVLAAATANAGRLAALKRDRSAFYAERNAAVLIQSELLGDRKNKPSVTLNQVTSRSASVYNPTRAVEINWEAIPASRVATHVTTNEDAASAIVYTPLQQYMCETVVKAYLGESGSMSDYNGDASVTYDGLAATSGTIEVTSDDIAMTASYSLEKFAPSSSNSDSRNDENWVPMESISDADKGEESFSFRILFRVKDQAGNDGRFKIVVPVQVYKNKGYGYRDANFNSGTKTYSLTRDDTISYTVNLDYAVIEKAKVAQPAGGGT